MRILPNGDGLSRNSHQGRRTNDRPRKNLRNHGLAYHPDYHQRSPKHTRTPRISSPLDPQLRKNRETINGLITEGQGIRMERTMRKSRPKTNRTSHFGTRHRTPRYRSTVHPLRGRLTICHWGNTIPSRQRTKRREGEPATTASGI